MNWGNVKPDGVKFFEKNMEMYGHYYEAPAGFTNAYFISDPTIIHKVLTSNSPHHLNRPREYGEILLKGFLEHSIFAADYGTWAPNKKILSRSFTYKSFQSYLGIMNSNAKFMTQKMSHDDSSSSATKQMALLQFYTVKIIAEIILGADVMTSDETLTFIKSHTTAKDIILERLLNPLLLLDPIWFFHPKKKELENCKIIGKQVITNIINKYRAKRKLEEEQGIEWVEESDDVGIKPFRSMVEEMLHGGMSDSQIEEEVIAIMVAGHETTSMAINTLMFHLARYPEYQKLCRDEVDDLMSSKMVEEDNDCELTMEDLSSLKYLEMCILENLRLTPTIPACVRRLDRPLKIDDDLELKGNGRNVVFIPWCLHRNPEFYPDPETFDPDRFLPENVKERQAKHSYSYVPFSGGQRNCIGWKLSIVEMKILMFWILRNFEFHTTDKFEDINFLVHFSLHPHRDINLVLKHRNPNV